MRRKLYWNIAQGLNILLFHISHIRYWVFQKYLDTWEKK